MVKHGPSDKNGKSSHLKMVAHAVTEPSQKKSNVGGRTGIQWRELKKLPLQERLNHVNRKRLCFNCLRSDHYVSNCPIQNSCRICQERHNTVLHPGYLEGIRKDTAVSGGTRPLPTAQTNVTTTQKQPELNTATVETYLAAASTQSHRSGNVFMLTVILVIVDAYGQHHFAWALLDSASQPNLLTERNFSSLNVTADLPERNVSIADWSIPKDLFLADPTFNERGSIDMIIGLPHFFDCFRSPARIRIARDLPEMVDSVFGWIVAGSGDLIPASPETVQCNVTAICLTTFEESLERFWKVEELPSRDDYSAEERECENLYTSTVARDRSGRYIVRLPRHPNFHSMLGESKAAALRRFRLLEQRLEREAEMKEEYHRFMREYISLGHMRLLGMNQHSSGNFYLPHHPVVKESSTTTKVRVVFDGSAKSSTGVSLNETLLTGPVVQDDLLSIVLRFRKFPVALVADIEEMYRQVLIHPEDTPYQRILWRFNESDPIQTYELLTVTYGLAPSSFLAKRTLQQLADDEGTAYPLADPILRKIFYVDDCLGGAQSVDEALQLRHELTELLSKGGLTLRKWTSNKLEVLQGLSSEQIGKQSSFVFAPHESVKALGIGWEPETDELRFESKISSRKAPERSILSSISQLFDPLGLIAPVVIRSKMFMQELWLAHCDWDQPVPNAIQEKWKTYHRDLAGIAEYRIDRYAFLPNAKVQLHTFSDASESVYGACVYARSTDTHGNVRVKLLASKSRVAPLDRITLPRLELCAAEIASQLYAHVKTALQLEISDARFWSDSTVTIQWLQAPPRTWKTFVANRVSKIQTLTHGYRWTHIPGKDNPADLVSRGMAVGEFVSSELWKYGPTWLRLPEEKWPAPFPLHVPVDNIEARKTSKELSDFHPLSKLIAKFYHLKLLHGGGQLTLAAMRETYWPVRGKRLVRSVIRNCLPCLRANPVPAQQRTGQLPIPRVTPSRPFTVTGVDYAGPVYLRPPHKRASPTKACIFVCFSTKAVHIELVSDLTTSAFLATFRRFSSRRGLPAHVHSDNGKNFEGARNEITELYLWLNSKRNREGIETNLANNGVTWHMTPPKTPHFGGLWEAAVKSAKKTSASAIS
ncbi:uncharacterized protein LOC129720474 [Wyeomyia smithii]|uniref:uncharacterized protein LOC129720474 n=1 Tax=Wyeomyia smithii TaxID=174621 RepID=UPI002467F908|nr:uncharacterized protein LOC129720474 [Wyeomyia smithii]